MPSKRKKILFIILAIAVVLLLNKVGGGFIKNGFYTAVLPLQKVLYKAGSGVSSFFAGLLRASSLKQEARWLLEENISLKQELLLLKAYEKENEALKQALGLAQDQGFQLVLGEVVLDLPEEEAVLISAGKVEGVLEDMPVVTQGGVLAGRTTQVLEHFSTVVLVSSEKIVFDIAIQATSSEGLLAVARGAGKGKLYFNLAPQEGIINKGALVQTTALGGKFPKGLLVGEISNVKKNDAKNFQEGEILPYFSKLPWGALFVITNFNTPR